MHLIKVDRVVLKPCSHHDKGCVSVTLFVCQVQERLSIIQNRKAEEDLLGLKHTDRLRHLTHDLPQVKHCMLRESFHVGFAFSPLNIVF